MSWADILPETPSPELDQRIKHAADEELRRLGRRQAIWSWGRWLIPTALGLGALLSWRAWKKSPQPASEDADFALVMEASEGRGADLDMLADLDMIENLEVLEQWTEK